MCSNACDTEFHQQYFSFQLFSTLFHLQSSENTLFVMRTKLRKLEMIGLWSSGLKKNPYAQCVASLAAHVYPTMH